MIIGVSISYQKIVHQTIIRILETNSAVPQFPISIKIVDGLDGSGSHQMYSQYHSDVNLSTKNYILFAFRVTSITDCNNNSIYSNDNPNATFGIRPVALIAQKECHESIRHLMENIINPECESMQQGMSFPHGTAKVKIIRSMLDGKMSAILSGAGGANCQLCTATSTELRDIDLVRCGFPINRTISSAKEIFSSVDSIEFLSLPSQSRFGITHEPISDIDILPASPLHSYTCIFRWFMLVIYHLQSGTRKWSPTSKKIQDSMKFTRTFLEEKTGFRIDQPSKDGGTTSTGNIARQCFLNCHDFIFWVNSLIPTEMRAKVIVIHTNLSAILRVYNSSQEINVDNLEELCKRTYETILVDFPWASITPTLHKEGVESCNKLIRRYRELLARKTSFSHNCKDVFIRLLTQSDPLFQSFRKVLRCKECGEYGHTNRIRCKKLSLQNNLDDSLINSLVLSPNNDNLEHY